MRLYQSTIRSSRAGIIELSMCTQGQTRCSGSKSSRPVVRYNKFTVIVFGSFVRDGVFVRSLETSVVETTVRKPVSFNVPV